MKMKKVLVAALIGVVAVAFSGCGSKGTIKVGSKDFTENEVVAEVYSLALEDAGYKVDREFNIAGSVIHKSITSNEIDIYPEYTGTGLLSILGEDMMTDPDKVYNEVKKQYNKKYKITWLDYSKANDGQGLVIKTSVAKKYGIKTISDLQKYATKLRFASQGEFDKRSDGLPALEKTYGAFNWKSSKIYDNGLKYQVLKENKADVAPAYTTEGQLVNTKQYTLLEDDKQVWPPYNLAPIVRNSVLEKYPDIAMILNGVSATLTTKNVTKMNARVDVDKEEYEAVAKDYYDSVRDNL